MKHFFLLASGAMINEKFYFSVSMAAIAREANSFITIMQRTTLNYPRKKWSQTDKDYKKMSLRCIFYLFA